MKTLFQLEFEGFLFSRHRFFLSFYGYCYSLLRNYYVSAHSFYAVEIIFYLFILP